MAKKQTELTKSKKEASDAPNSQKNSKVARGGASSASAKTNQPAGLKSNENWKVIACPECKNQTNNKLVEIKGDKWHLRCKSCRQEWFENIATGESSKAGEKTPKKPRKSQQRKAKITELFETAKENVRQKREKQRGEQPQPEKPAEKRDPHATRPTPEEEPIIIQRQNLVWELKKAKRTFREISRHLAEYKDKETGELVFAGVGTSVAQVHADYHFMLELNRKEQEMTVKDETQEEIEILNEVHREFYPILKRPAYNPQHGGRVFRDEAKRDAADVIIMCVKERAKLKNLYKPTEVKINTDETLAALLGLTVEELPDDEDGDS